MRRAPELSVVVPVYNEELNVGELAARIRATLAPSGRPYEALFVDDGSSDRTLEALLDAQHGDPAIRVLRLRRNYGQTAAMKAGIDHARGDIIVTMDGDLQNDPRDIPAMVAKVEQGYDLVTGWRRARRDPWISRKLPSKIANGIIRRVTGVRIHDTGCSLKAYRADLIRRVPLYAEMHRFIPAMCTLASQRIAEVVVQHHPRTKGQSKYGLSRIGRVLLDVITIKMLITFSRRPLHWFGGWAFLSLTIGLLTGTAELLRDTLVAGAVPTIVLPTVAFLFSGLGLHLLMIGMIGELIVRVDRQGPVEPLARQVRVSVPSLNESVSHGR